MLDLEALKDVLIATYEPSELIELLELTSDDLVEYLSEVIEHDSERLTQIVLQDQEDPTED
jgi:hypothetical protein